jgi:hypothetical protein
MAYEVYIRVSDTEGREERLRSVEHQDSSRRPGVFGPPASRFP